MYTCSSPTLVRLSALRCFRWPAMLSFSSSFITFIQSYFVCRFFFFLSPHWLIWTSDVCLSVQSLMELVVLSMLFYLCRAVARCICHPVDSTRGATALWPHYWAIWPFFFSLCTVVVTLFDLPFFGSCIIPFFHTASATKDLALKNLSWTSVHIGSCCLLSDWMEREYCTFSSMQLSLSPCIIPTRGSEG